MVFGPAFSRPRSMASSNRVSGLLARVQDTRKLLHRPASTPNAPTVFGLFSPAYVSASARAGFRSARSLAMSFFGS